MVDGDEVCVFCHDVRIGFSMPLSAAAQDRARASAPENEVVQLETVTVVGRRIPLTSFPGAVSVVDVADAGESKRQVSLTEVLLDVPGILGFDRGNFA